MTTWDGHKHDGGYPSTPHPITFRPSERAVVTPERLAELVAVLRERAKHWRFTVHGPRYAAMADLVEATAARHVEGRYSDFTGATHCLECGRRWPDCAFYADVAALCDLLLGPESSLSSTGGTPHD